jgi:hypothetical protein
MQLVGVAIFGGLAFGLFATVLMSGADGPEGLFLMLSLSVIFAGFISGLTTRAVIAVLVFRWPQRPDPSRCFHDRLFRAAAVVQCLLSWSRSLPGGGARSRPAKPPREPVRLHALRTPGSPPPTRSS